VIPIKEPDVQENLIRKSQNGDMISFRDLIINNQRFVFTVAFKILCDEETAREVTQECFIKVWKNIHKYKNGQNFKTWLFTIAKNSTIDFLRKRKVFTFSDLEKKNDDFIFSETIEAEDLLPEEAFQKLQDKEFLNKLLEKISTEYKTILLLHYQEEMTFAEISTLLKKPLNTVKSYHRRAILDLRKML